jgi:hypothetical protein
MAGVVFPSIANALVPLMQMDQQREDRTFQRERATRQDALHAEESKYRRESLDEQRAMRIQSHLATMDEKKRAMVQDFAKFRVQAGGAVLSAPPEQRPQAYAMYVQEAKQRGYDMSLFPQQWDPSTERKLQFDVDQSIPWADRPQAMPAPGGSAPAPGGAPALGGEPETYDPTRARAAIKGNESGGRYDALGPNTGRGRAYGAYQVMDFNIGPWTAEVLGKPMTPQEFLNNPEAQDKVFDAKFGGYVKKYGNHEAAARAWFAGEGGMNNPGAKDVLGTDVAAYAQKFNKGFGGPQVAGAGGFTPTNMPAQNVPGGLTQMPAQGDAVAGQGDVMAPPRAAPPSIGNEVDELRRQTRASGGDIFTVKGQPEIQNGNYVVRSLQNPRQVVGMVPVKSKESGPSGPFAGNNPDVQAFNYLVSTGKMTVEQAANVLGGKSVTNPADGSIVFIPASQLAGVGAAPPAQTPGAPAAPPSAGPPGSVQLTPPKPDKMTDEQAKAAGFSDRMVNSNKILDGVAGEGGKFFGRLKEAVPFNAANSLQSDDYQSFKQARDDFINAQLRRESGAVINADEYTKADQQYFPVPGDSDATLKQKAENRRLAVEGMKRSAGPAYAKEKARATDKPTGAPKVGDEQDGYLFKGGDPSQPSSWEKVR